MALSGIAKFGVYKIINQFQINDVYFLSFVLIALVLIICITRYIICKISRDVDSKRVDYIHEINKEILKSENPNQSLQNYYDTPKEEKNSNLSQALIELIQVVIEILLKK